MNKIDIGDIITNTVLTPVQLHTNDFANNLVQYGKLYMLYIHAIINANLQSINSLVVGTLSDEQLPGTIRDDYLVASGIATIGTTACQAYLSFDKDITIRNIPTVPRGTNLTVNIFIFKK